MATSNPARVAVPARIINGKKTFTVLENNPEILTTLAHTLGLSPSLQFVDIYSFTDTDLSHLPRPALGLIAIIPPTASWKADRLAEDVLLSSQATTDKQANEAANNITWFKQTIGEACGSYALIHTALNGATAAHLTPISTLANILAASNAFKNGSMQERAEIVYANHDLEVAHQEAAQLGDSEAPEVDEHGGKGFTGHFVAWVKNGGRLWELEGSRNQALNRGALSEEEDVLSENGIKQGIGRIMELERESGGGELRFSVVALVEKREEYVGMVRRLRDSVGAAG